MLRNLRATKMTVFLQPVMRNNGQCDKRDEPAHSEIHPLPEADLKCLAAWADDALVEMMQNLDVPQKRATPIEAAVHAGVAVRYFWPSHQQYDKSMTQASDGLLISLADGNAST